MRCGEGGQTRAAHGVLRAVQLVLVVLMAATLCASLGGCKISDRLTEVIYDQESEDIDYDNPSKVLVQDTEAEETTTELPLVETGDEEKDDQEEEDPTEDEEETTDEEATTADVTQQISTTYSTTTGGSLAAGNNGSGGEGEDSEGGSEASEESDDETSGGDAEGAGKGGSEGDASSALGGESGARSGGDTTYYAEVGTNQQVASGIDYVAACGEAATIVSMLAGDAGALLYTDAEWASRSKIKKVLGSRYNTDVVQAWSDDGDSYDLSDAMLQTMIEDERLECVFVMSGCETLTDAQQDALEEAGIVIQVLPDMTTATNITATVEWVGRMFEAGDNQNSTALERAEAYVQFHDELLEEVADVASTSTTDNSGKPVSSSGTQYYTLYVSDWVKNVSYVGSSADLSTKYGIGICTVGYAWSPLYYYMSVGGAYSTSSVSKGNYTSGTTLVWQFNTNQLTMKESDFSKSSLVTNYQKNSGNTAYGWTYLCSSGYIGVGTDQFPLVITDTQDSAERMLADREYGESSDSINSLYELYPLISYTTGSVTYSWVGLQGTSSVMCYAVGGLTSSQSSGQTYTQMKNALEGSTADYDVVTNPEGLFGESWTQGSVESVLEAAWISYLYYPDEHESNYVAQTIADFYAEFYGYALSSSELETILAGPED